ncbi:MAG: hypothetical protein KME02_12715 [Aphanothece saxicola GSE-SYN-MK-01-06B]|nr:hypothetical protein [Aphanothece saxicola GSE-SYN-MK-01-06B]
MALSALVKPATSLTTTMSRYLWHLDTYGWPLERIDTETGEHIPVFTGVHEESLRTQDGGRPIACSIRKVSGVEWELVGDSHSRKTGDVLGGMRAGGG